MNSSYESALAEITRVESLVHEKETEIERLQLKLEKEEGQHVSQMKDIKTKLAEIESKFQDLSAANTETELRLTTSISELAAARSLQTNLTTIPGAPFYDADTQKAIVCPVLQSNGHIVSFNTICLQWLSNAGPDDGYPHRTYICPITQQPTTLASMATQDRIRSIAQNIGLHVKTPFVFSYVADDGCYEFRFQDQLNIIATVSAMQTAQTDETVEYVMVRRNTMKLMIKATRVRDFYFSCYSRK